MHENRLAFSDAFDFLVRVQSGFSFPVGPFPIVPALLGQLVQGQFRRLVLFEIDRVLFPLGVRLAARPAAESCGRPSFGLADQFAADGAYPIDPSVSLVQFVPSAFDF